MKAKATISILGCGWLGLSLARLLIAKTYQVKGSTTSSEKKNALSEEGIEAYTIDLNDMSDKLNTLTFLASKVIVVMVPPRFKRQEADVYLSQMQKLVEFIKEINFIEHVIYTSSTSVYKDQIETFKETDLTSKEDAESVTLFDVEQLFLSLSSKKVTILRLGGLTGGNRMLAKHFAGKKDLGGGGHPVNLVHWEDAIGIIIKVVETGLTGVFNVCAPIHPKKKHFYTELSQRFNLATPHFLEEKIEGGKTIDSSKIQAAGYVFQYPDPYLFTYDI